MYKRILVPLDGSTFGEFALPTALSVARRQEAAVELVSVVTPAIPPPFVEGLTNIETQRHEEAERHAREYLADVLTRVRDAAGTDVPISTETLVGPIAQTLDAHATDTGVDLIAMTTHGRGPLRRAWLGSVADGLVRRAPCPLILIRPREEEKPDLALDVRFGHVLVPLDGSDAALAVLPDAIEIGRPSGAFFSLLKVMLPAFPLGSPYLPHLVEDEWEHAQARDAAARYLDDVAAQLEENGLNTDTTVLTDNRPADAILEYAERHGVDLLAMTTHGRGGVPRMIMGSVADKVVRGAEVPILIRRASES